MEGQSVLKDYIHPQITQISQIQKVKN